MSMVRQQLEAPVSLGGYGLTTHDVNTGGYRITTTFQPDLVNALANSVQVEQARMQADGLPFKSYDRIGAVLEDPKTGGILAVYGGPGYGSSNCATSGCWINMAESPQPVGSSFKVYVLSAAVNEGMNVFSSQLNGFSPIWIPEKSTSTMLTQMTLSATSPPQGVSPQAVGGYSGNIYYFKFDEKNENSGKPLPVNVAAAISSDPSFEDLAHRDGIDNVIAMAKAFGVGQNPFVQPCSVPASGLETATQSEIIQNCNDMTGSVNGLDLNFGTQNPSKTALANGTPGSPAIALGENPLTPVEQATTMATLADDGIYHTPHVIAVLQQNGGTLPSHITTTQVLSPEAAADVDWALSFDNNMGGGTAQANVSFRRGGVIGKTGTLGSGANSSQAWFIGATPSQDALAVALFTDSPGTENLNNLPSVGGMPGSQGGGWPATIWNNFMTTEFGNTPASPMYATANGSPFVAWIQAQPTTPPVCQYQFGQTQGQGSGQQQCTCPNNASWCSNQNQNQQNCPPGQFQGQGQGQAQPCGGPSPSTSPCQVFCKSPPIKPSPAATTAAITFGSPASNSRGSPALAAGWLYAEAARQTQVV
jgi:membrane peptidoglycan carboxypeptidase